MEIYERIKARRKELSLSADDVAEALHVNRATVYRYESADIEKIPITSIQPLADVLHCSPAYLMGWEERKTPPKEEERQRRLMKYASLLSDEYFDKLEERAEELLALSEMKGKKEDVG